MVSDPLPCERVEKEEDVYLRHHPHMCIISMIGALTLQLSVPLISTDKSEFIHTLLLDSHFPSD